jgi:hypothetical protein
MHVCIFLIFFFFGTTDLSRNKNSFQGLTLLRYCLFECYNNNNNNGRFANTHLPRYRKEIFTIKISVVVQHDNIN